MYLLITIIAVPKLVILDPTTIGMMDYLVITGAITLRGIPALRMMELYGVHRIQLQEQQDQMIQNR